MLDQVLTKELKALVVLAEEHSVVLLSLLESLDLLLNGVGLIHGRNEILLYFRILYLQSLHPGYRRLDLRFVSKVLQGNVKTLPQYLKRKSNI